MPTFILSEISVQTREVAFEVRDLSELQALKIESRSQLWLTNCWIVPNSAGSWTVPLSPLCGSL